MSFQGATVIKLVACLAVMMPAASCLDLAEFNQRANHSIDVQLSAPQFTVRLLQDVKAAGTQVHADGYAAKVRHAQAQIRYWQSFKQADVMLRMRWMIAEDLDWISKRWIQIEKEGDPQKQAYMRLTIQHAENRVTAMQAYLQKQDRLGGR